MAGIHAVLAGLGGRVPVTITLAANETNYVLNTAKVTNYIPGQMDVTLVINSGVIVSANSTAQFGLDVDTSWNANDTLTIVNNGTIAGMGGAGGVGAGFNNFFPPSAGVDGSAGGAGGPALRAQRSATVNNLGTIAGGGGGGGGGANGNGQSTGGKTTAPFPVGGGGGGGGRSGTTSSALGAGGFAPSGGSGGNGGAGTSTAPGAGGANRSTDTGETSGVGAAGGAYGTSGGTGGNRSGWNMSVSTALQRGPYGGGAAGAAVAGNANITWAATGTRLGAIT